MKRRTPLDRDDLTIKCRDYVVDVGSGDNPMLRADVLVEPHLRDNSQRGGDMKIYRHQLLVDVNGEAMPFDDGRFDYAVCSHVIEYANNPERLLSELTRVASRGYIEMPSLLGEVLTPSAHNRWVAVELDGRLLIFATATIAEPFRAGLAELCRRDNSPLRSRLKVDAQRMLTIRYEWSDGVDFVVNPADEECADIFAREWDAAMIDRLFPPRSTFERLSDALRALPRGFRRLCRLARGRRHPMNLDQYLKAHRLI